MKWQVVVGNIGTVYDGDDEKLARQAFEHYKKQSLIGVFSRAAHEDVTLLKDGDITAEHKGGGE